MLTLLHLLLTVNVLVKKKNVYPIIKVSICVKVEETEKILSETTNIFETFHYVP